MFSAKTGLAATLLLAFCYGSPAGAATVNYARFYTGGTTYAGPYSGAGTVYAATKNLGTNCPTAVPGCTSSSADRLDTTQTYIGLPTLTATASGTNKVWDDLSPAFAGLGVGLTSQGSDADQIAGSDILKLTFSSVVKLTGVGTLFDSPHTPFSEDTSFDTVSDITSHASTIKFKLSLDLGVHWLAVTFADANNILLNYESSTFWFKESPAAPPAQGARRRQGRPYPALFRCSPPALAQACLDGEGSAPGNLPPRDENHASLERPPRGGLFVARFARLPGLAQSSLGGLSRAWHPPIGTPRSCSTGKVSATDIARCLDSGPVFASTSACQPAAL